MSGLQANCCAERVNRFRKEMLRGKRPADHKIRFNVIRLNCDHFAQCIERLQAGNDFAGREHLDLEFVVGRLGDRGEMAEQALRSGLVVIGGDLEGAVGPHFFRPLGQIDRLGGGVGAGAGEDFDPARGKFHRVGDDLNMLLIIQRGRFARRAHRHQTVHLLGNLPIHQFANFSYFLL